MKMRSPEFLINTTKNKCVACGWTLVLTFSRRWCVEPFFKAFDKLKFDKSRCHLLVIDNTDNILLQNALLPLIEKTKDDYFTCRYYKTYRRGGMTLRGEINNDFYKSKIYPISELQKDVLSLVCTDTFVQLEDDEAPQNPHTITRLLDLLSQENCAVATGVSSARNPDLTTVGMGIHQFVERDGDRITKRICCSPHTKGVVKVQATGFYCFAAKSEIWEEAMTDCFSIASGLPFWAFDTWVTNQIVRKGYDILADFDLWVDHLQVLPKGVYHFNKKDARIDAYVYLPLLDVYCYWQNSKEYGAIIEDTPESPKVINSESLKMYKKEKKEKKSS